MKLIANDMLLNYTVEKAGFKNLVKELDPKLKMPSYSSFKRTALPQLYYKVKS